MKKIFFFGLGISLSIFLAGIAFAATVTVTIPDKAEGDSLTAAEFNQIVDVLEGVQNITGSIGIGTAPDTSVKLDIDGSMKLAPQSSGGTCSTSLEGVVYVKTDGHWYGCNGTGWMQLDN